MKINWLKQKYFKNKVFESGRSMAEMLGVLSLIGVLSLGALAGYGWAMDKYRSNVLTNEVLQRAVDVKHQLDRRRRNITLNRWNGRSLIGYQIGLEDGTPVTIDGRTTVGIQVDAVKKRVCQMTFDNMVGIMKTKVDDVIYEGPASDVCQEGSTMVFYLDDGWEYGRVAEVDGCTSDEECRGGSCVDGVCVDECPEGQKPMCLTLGDDMVTETRVLSCKPRGDRGVVGSPAAEGDRFSDDTECCSWLISTECTQYTCVPEDTPSLQEKLEEAEIELGRKLDIELPAPIVEIDPETEEKIITEHKYPYCAVEIKGKCGLVAFCDVEPVAVVGAAIMEICPSCFDVKEGDTVSDFVRDYDRAREICALLDGEEEAKIVKINDLTDGVDALISFGALYDEDCEPCIAAGNEYVVINGTRMCCPTSQEIPGETIDLGGSVADTWGPCGSCSPWPTVEGKDGRRYTAGTSCCRAQAYTETGAEISFGGCSSVTNTAYGNYPAQSGGFMGCSDWNNNQVTARSLMAPERAESAKEFIRTIRLENVATNAVDKGSVVEGVSCEGDALTFLKPCCESDPKGIWLSDEDNSSEDGMAEVSSSGESSTKRTLDLKSSVKQTQKDATGFCCKEEVLVDPRLTLNSPEYQPQAARCCREFDREWAYNTQTNEEGISMGECCEEGDKATADPEADSEDKEQVKHECCTPVAEGGTPSGSRICCLSAGWNWGEIKKDEKSEENKGSQNFEESSVCCKKDDTIYWDGTGLNCCEKGTEIRPFLKVDPEIPYPQGECGSPETTTPEIYTSITPEPDVVNSYPDTYTYTDTDTYTYTDSDPVSYLTDTMSMPETLTVTAIETATDMTWETQLSEVTGSDAMMTASVTGLSSTPVSTTTQNKETTTMSISLTVTDGADGTATDALFGTDMVTVTPYGMTTIPPHTRTTTQAETPTTTQTETPTTTEVPMTAMTATSAMTTTPPHTRTTTVMTTTQTDTRTTTQVETPTTTVTTTTSRQTPTTTVPAGVYSTDLGEVLESTQY